jgi:hypothetical protein
LSLPPNAAHYAEVTNKLLTGYKIGDMTYKVYLDGYSLKPYPGKPPRPRESRSSTSATISNWWRCVMITEPKNGD